MVYVGGSIQSAWVKQRGTMGFQLLLHVFDNGTIVDNSD